MEYCLLIYDSYGPYNYGHGEERFVHAAHKNYISDILFKFTELYYAGIITLESALINTVLSTSILLTRRSPEQNGCYFTDDIYKCTPLNEDRVFIKKICGLFLKVQLANTIIIFTMWSKYTKCATNFRH